MNAEVVINVVISIVFVGLLVYFVFKRISDKKAEDFEDREN